MSQWCRFVDCSFQGSQASQVEITKKPSRDDGDSDGRERRRPEEGSPTSFGSRTLSAAALTCVFSGKLAVFTGLSSGGRSGHQFFLLFLDGDCVKTPQRFSICRPPRGCSLSGTSGRMSLHHHGKRLAGLPNEWVFVLWLIPPLSYGGDPSESVSVVFT